jgi:ATP-dependent DNA helicase RecG
MSGWLDGILGGGETEEVEFKSSFNVETIETLVAFANRKGGSVFVGVGKGRVQGVQLSPESVQQWLNEIKGKTEPSLVPDAELVESQGKTVVVLEVPEYPIKPVSVQGRYYIRKNNSNHLLSTSEVVDLHLRSINLSWDCYPDHEHSLDSISLEKVQAVIDRMNAKERRIHDAPLAFLHKYSLVRDSGELTFAAFLLFSREPGIATTVELGRFQDPITIKDSARSQHDLIEQVEILFTFVKKHINKEVVVSGKLENTERWQYPLDAVREIVLNMVVHRDYRSAADSVIKVFDDRVEFFNPGSLPDGLSVERLLSGNYRSSPRNRAVATLFKDLGLIEKYGSGIRRVLDLCKAQGLPAPLFEDTPQGFVATLFSSPKIGGLKDGLNGRLKGGLNPTQHRVLELVRSRPGIQAHEIAAELGMPPDTLDKILSKLAKERKIERRGSKKTGGYHVHSGGLDGGLSGGLNPTQHRVLELVRSHAGIQARELALELDMPLDTLDKVLSKLVKERKIERLGSKKTGGYHEVENE